MPQIVALIKNHLRPNLSEILPNRMRDTAEETVQMIENKLEFGLGPDQLSTN
jgi:hypothetical protein